MHLNYISKVFRSTKLLCILVLLTACFGTSQAGNDNPSPNLGEWDVFEINLTTTNTYSNPYLDVLLNATFIGPNNSKIKIDGFWDGNNTWKIRMAPTEIGTWSYVTSSSDSMLDGKIGGFEVIESDKKGFLKINPDYPYSFMYEDGTPFFWMGDTQWWFPSIRSNLGFDDGTFQRYVDERSAQKFNHMHGVIWHSDDILGNEGGIPFITENKDTINPVFFQWLDKRIAYMDSKGIVAGILLGWADQDIYTKFTTVQLTRFKRYVIARYAAYNIVWELIGEFEERSSSNQSRMSANEACQRIDPLGNTVENFDPYKHLTSTHPQYTNSICVDRIWLDYIMHQTSNLSMITSERIFNEPVINEEFYYESPTHSHHTVRKAAWEIVLRGGYITYGNTRTFLDVDFNYINTSGAKYMTNLYNFFQNKEFWKMSPNNSIATSGHTLTIPGKEYVIYLPAGGSTTVNFSSARGTLFVEWYNPSTGIYQEKTIVPGGASRTFTAPDSNDWVLHINSTPTTYFQYLFKHFDLLLNPLKRFIFSG